MKITQFELISLISERKCTFSTLCIFSSAQADEFNYIYNMIFKINDYDGVKSVIC